VIPVAVLEAITTDPELNSLGINAGTVFEMQSVKGDERPKADLYFVMVDFQEQTLTIPLNRGPRVLDVAVHVPQDVTREFTTINRILSRIDAILLDMEQSPAATVFG
jgi:hypothetical protein